MRRVLRVVAFGSLAAGGTVAAGWWMVPVVTAVWVRVLPSDRRPIRTTMLGAALAWLMLIGLAAVHGPALALAGVLSGALDLPRYGFLAATAVYPALLAGATALLVRPTPIA